MTRLLGTWMILVSLTLAGMAAGGFGGAARLGVGGAALVVAVAAVKARWIVLDFLGLRHGGAGMRGLLTAWLVVVAGAIFAAHLAVVLRAA